MKTMLLSFSTILISFVLVLGGTSCKKDPEDDTVWSVPKDKVLDGGPGKDGIPSIDNPKYIPADEATYLSGSSLVVGYKYNETIRAYPHEILDWHEIVNDQMDDHAIAITYCPLTGTAIGWDRTVGGLKTTFGVSGLLFNSNLIPYDRATNSSWSQMLMKGISGDQINQSIPTYMVVETTWDTWKNMYPETEVLSRETGIDRSYGSYPYGDYRSNHDRLVFPVDVDDSRLPRKERVHGIISDDKASVYQLTSFSDSLKIIHDTLDSAGVIIVGSNAANLAVSFEAKLKDGSIPSFKALQNRLPNILEDSEGNLWDVFGYATEGPRKGQRLIPTQSYIGYWFAWGAFFPGANIYEN